MIEGSVQKPIVNTRRIQLPFDLWLVVLTAVMLVLGMVMVYSASWDVSWRLFGDHNAIFNRQLTNLVLGLGAMLVAAWFPLDWLRRAALPLIVATIIILFAVLIVNLGGEYKRAFLGASVQPSELAKLALVIYLAVWMESKGERLSDLGYGFMPLVFIVGLVGGLIVAQPDLSAGLTIGLVSLTMFYLAGAQTLQTLGSRPGGRIRRLHHGPAAPDRGRALDAVQGWVVRHREGFLPCPAIAPGILQRRVIRARAGGEQGEIWLSPGTPHGQRLRHRR